MTRIRLDVFVDLDRIPGTFHTKESAAESVQSILEDRIPHYNPNVVPTEVKFED